MAGKRKNFLAIGGKDNVRCYRGVQSLFEFLKILSLSARIKLRQFFVIEKLGAAEEKGKTTGRLPQT